MKPQKNNLESACDYLLNKAEVDEYMFYQSMKDNQKKEEVTATSSKTGDSSDSDEDSTRDDSCSDEDGDEDDDEDEEM